MWTGQKVRLKIPPFDRLPSGLHFVLRLSVEGSLRVEDRVVSAVEPPAMRTVWLRPKLGG